MDLLRACYTTSIRPFVDSDYEEKIRWYFCPEPLAVAPLRDGSRFGSGNYKNEDYPWPGPGEVLGALRPFSHGRPPYIPIVPGPAGQLSWFQEGAPWSARGTLPRRADGMPLPCAGGIGGVLIGGEGVFIGDVAGVLLGGVGVFDSGILVGDGGVEVNSNLLPIVTIGDGGVEVDGLVGVGMTIGDGGVEVDGLVGVGMTIGDGGVEVDGIASTMLSIGDGGVEVDGSVAATFATGDGGVEVDGLVGVGMTIGDGGVEVGGSVAATFPVGDGGVEVNGFVVILDLVGDGGVEVDGLVTPVAPIVPTSTCVGAPLCAFDTDYSNTLTGSGDHWFALPTVTSGVKYLKVTLSGGGGSNIAFMDGTCPGFMFGYLGSIGTGCTSGSLSPFGPFNGIRVQNSSGTLSYTWRFGSGTCPP